MEPITRITFADAARRGGGGHRFALLLGLVLVLITISSPGDPARSTRG